MASRQISRVVPYLCLALTLGATAIFSSLVPTPPPFVTGSNSGTSVTGFPPNPYLEAGAHRAARVIALGCPRAAQAVLDHDVLIAVELPAPEPDWAFLFEGVPRVRAADGLAAILALGPDLVALTDSVLAMSLRSAGIAVVEVGQGDPDPAGEAFDRIAAAAGVPERGPVERTVWVRRQAFAAEARR